ncbi:hypothetical protein DY000_02054684 [Brassica cretica]|uniref:Zinc knuckle CX2CX4HX4C domain-containing protein n=1 Tax=Brassica cretica TaxID=69181 RepID=A0ABQ7AFE6_BRACR|nr:hypothetical protein DY000_02054684 [Brassica cretica]
MTSSLKPLQSLLENFHREIFLLQGGSLQACSPRNLRINLDLIRNPFFKSQSSSLLVHSHVHFSVAVADSAPFAAVLAISGIPIHLLKKQAVEGLISLLGKVDKKTVNFKTGEAISTELEYEKLLKVCFRCKRLTHDRNIFPLRIHAEDQAVALEEGPSRMRNSHSHASGKDKGKAVMELVLRKKETPEAAKPTEGGSSNSVGGSIQSSLRKTKSHEKKTSEEDRSAGFSSRNLTVSPTVFQRLGSSPHSSELEERRSSVFARQGDLSTPLEIVISRESSQQKRRRISPQDDRRFSSSDEQTSKKQRKGPISERLEAPSVFHRLGGISSSSGAHSEGRREWNEDLIREVLSEEEWREIQKIRPGGPACKDSYCWDFTPSGHYTVNSDYWVAANLLKAKEVEEILQPSLDGLFQAVWKADTSPKIHNFM